MEDDTLKICGSTHFEDNQFFGTCIHIYLLIDVCTYGIHIIIHIGPGRKRLRFNALPYGRNSVQVMQLLIVQLSHAVLYH